MRKMVVFLLFFSLLILSTSSFAAPSVSAQAALVLEQSTGRVLYEKNADSKLPMASTTKIITALVALENAEQLDEPFKISATAAGVEGSSMYLEAGETMTLRELLYGLMLSSGNDAAVAIAERFGGIDTFVTLMNQKAKELGANNTHFTNPNGLPDENHYSSARDMATLTAYAMNNPAFCEIVSTKTFTVSGEGKSYPRTLSNHNKLLRLCEGCIGVKTGFTKAAGRCLVSAAKRENMTLICVTLNAPDDWNDHQNLYKDLFVRYHLTPILHTGLCLDSISIENSETTTLPVTPTEDFSYPLTDKETCTTELSLSPPLSAPVADKTDAGTVTVRLEDKELKTIPLCTVGNAPRASIFSSNHSGFLKRIFNAIGHWFDAVF